MTRKENERSSENETLVILKCYVSTSVIYCISNLHDVIYKCFITTVHRSYYPSIPREILVLRLTVVKMFPILQNANGCTYYHKLKQTEQPDHSPLACKSVCFGGQVETTAVTFRVEECAKTEVAGSYETSVHNTWHCITLNRHDILTPLIRLR